MNSLFSLHVIFNMDVLLLSAFIFVFLLSYHILTRLKNLPPGPTSLPIFGSIYVIRQMKRKRPYMVMTELSETYGPVFSFRLGKQLFVILNGYDVISEAFVKRHTEFSDRPISPLAKHFVVDPKSIGIIANQYNHNWKVLRRFTLQALRDFGVGKSSLEERIATEIKATSKRFVDLGDELVDINAAMQLMISNIIYGIVFGIRYDYDDPEFSKVRLMSGAIFKGDGALNLFEFLPGPVIKLLMYFSKHVSATVRLATFKRISDFVNENVSQHETTFDENVVRDFIDLTLKHHVISRIQIIQNLLLQKEAPNQWLLDLLEVNKEYIDMQDFTGEPFLILRYNIGEQRRTGGGLLRVINDLFIAGTETTYTALDWVFLYMAEYPDVQKKCQDEIFEKLGDKHIQFADRDKLPYVCATLLEIQRKATILPLGTAHVTNSDVKFHGYTIPDKTIIITNLYSASVDSKYWSEPDEFKPERFLGDDRRVLKVDAFIPFSTGPRQCLGEPLAKMELFLIFTNLVQRFSFHREDDGIPHSMRSRHFQATNCPEPYKLRVKSRE